MVHPLRRADPFPGVPPNIETARRGFRRWVMDDEPFQTLIEQVRDLHRRTDELNRSKAQSVHANVRARLSWNTAPSLPEHQRDLADEIVEALSTPRLSHAQSRQLWRAYFGK
jgi:hypothetical protein